ncbi:hypothetical protein [Salmonella enterica]
MIYSTKPVTADTYPITLDVVGYQP